jgi:hypothetical protein
MKQNPNLRLHFLKILLSKFGIFVQMYTREEASRLRHAFWTTFGQYMSPYRSAEGLKVNWVNYNTRVKNVFFRMQANQKEAYIAIEMNHADVGIQELYFEQFLEFRTILHSILGEEWDWSPMINDEYGKTISRIYKELKPVNVFNQEDWGKLITFFKPRIVALDEFWTDAKYKFEELK